MTFGSAGMTFGSAGEDVGCCGEDVGGCGNAAGGVYSLGRSVLGELGAILPIDRTEHPSRKWLDGGGRWVIRCIYHNYARG